MVRLGLVPVLDRSLAPQPTFWVSYFVSLATHYGLNRFWALRSSRRDWHQQLVEYGLTAALGAGLQYGVFLLCFYRLGWNQFWSNAFSVPPSTIVVITILNYRVFRAGSRA